MLLPNSPIAPTEKCSNLSAHPWFGLRVKPHREALASACLRAKGYQELSPTYTSRRRWSDRFKEIELPLFPGYLFCRFDPSFRLPVLTTPGVLGVVGLGSQPQPIADAEMDAISALVRTGALAQPFPFLGQGDRVRIAEGPLTGTEGIIVTVEDRCRLVVSVSLLQRSISIEIARHWVRPMGRLAS